jgi:hypothetical protein
MQIMTRLIVSTPILAALLFSGAAVAQHEGHGGPEKAQDPAKATARVGDAFAFDTCPISGKKLGSMGDPIVKVYDGREVRYCCGGCPKKFEKDLVASFEKLDAKILEDQMALYPLKTSIVTGKDLPAKPIDFVFGNRLIRVGSDKEKAEFRKDSGKFLATLDKAVVAEQGKDYVLKACPSSGEAYGGDMRDAVDLVVAGRLVRLCCKDCTKDVEKEPAKFVAIVDAARKGKVEKGGDHKKEHDHKEGQGK